MKSVALSLSVLLVATWPDAAVAEKADRDKPAHIEADSLSHDDLKQVSIFTGRAVLTKGTLVLRGARIEIREDADGYQHGVVLPEAGKRAFFRQKREGLNEFLEAEGARIDYDGRADKVTILDQAEVRRFRGAVLADQMNGQRIVYENLTDVFSVDGQIPGQASAPTGRVRATLVPREKRASDLPTSDKPASDKVPGGRP